MNHDLVENQIKYRQKKSPLLRAAIKTKRRESYENKYSFTFHESIIGVQCRFGLNLTQQ